MAGFSTSSELQKRLTTVKPFFALKEASDLIEQCKCFVHRSVSSPLLGITSKETRSSPLLGITSEETRSVSSPLLGITSEETRSSPLPQFSSDGVHLGGKCWYLSLIKLHYIVTCRGFEFNH